jgi:hypothetical protein
MIGHGSAVTGANASGLDPTLLTSRNRRRSSSVSPSLHSRPAEARHCCSSPLDSFRIAASLICLMMPVLMLDTRARRRLHSRRLTNAIDHASLCQPVDQLVAYCHP